ncbi:MAG TPA: MFS transporter [Actinomycetes bacterium]
MLGPYRDLLATPGGLRLSASAFVARLPIAMDGLGIVLLVVAETGSYGRAGALSATFALVNACAAPAVARLIDRFGQRRVLLPTVPVHAVAFLSFAWLAAHDGPTWAQVATVVVAALLAPSIGALVRARWGYVLGDDPRLHTAYALESVLDELIFVLGPLVVTVLATDVAPGAGVVAAVVLVVGGTAALLSHTSTEAPVVRHLEAHPNALRTRGLPSLMLVMVFTGGVFGAVELSAVAFADHAGHRPLAGALLACYAGGSMVSGLVFGAIRGDLAPRRSLAVGLAVMTVTAVVLPAVSSLAVLAPLLFVAGLGIAPSLISGFTLVERTVPARAVTEGLTWLTTALVVGFSGSTWLAGQLVDGAGVGWAFAVGAGSAAVALVVVVSSYRMLDGSGELSTFSATGRARLPGGDASQA